MSIGSRIKSAREAKKLTQEELGLACGTTKQTIFKYETGVITNIPLDRLERIATALNVTPASLMGWESQAPSVPEIPGAVSYTPALRRIPVLGSISAGLPLYAEENIEGYIYTELNSGGEYFALRVKGDSMNAARIMEGDILVVRRQDQVENGEIAVVMVGDEDATVKRFFCGKGIVTLMPQSTNPEHTPQIYDPAKTPVKVIGRVMQTIIRY